MTTYRITAVLTESGRKIVDKITDANEAAAKKSFREVYRHGGAYNITSVEPIKDNVSASKQQERDAIAKIRAILETLGPMSYTGTALEGCLEIADQNIEFDFGDSMKQRCESAEKKVTDLESRLADSVKDYEAAHAAAHAIAEEKDTEIAALKKQIEALQRKVPDGDDIYDCIQLVNDKRCDSENRMQEAAEQIVQFADNPSSSEFQQAVAQHRSHKSDYEYYTNLGERLAASK